ncbi:LiaF transmembrane domain-containing protein [Alkaliphilus serpentinus]|uniref:LiaF transmembrane domain-containing protein n=1 Tax=Alkaliphilus serpentinus TaxID=1482731 RepID=A0A833HPA7_9FIRM|nr:DUF5668 domain-containing protein [Alkaliphilus serpentinus]KAB3530550.1 hypothetical protein F8153_06790 [Alkaliphilus serpentinus]
MRQWRVGTLSMGLTLIVLGITLLLSMINGYEIASYVIKFWPVILIVIGVEILLYIYLSKEESPKVKYDGFSIFMIILIAIISLGFYSISAIGILPRLAAMAEGVDYSLNIKLQEKQVDSTIDKIVVDLPNNYTYIGSTHDQKILLSGKGNVFAISKDNAEDLLRNIELVTYQVDNTLHISVDGIQRNNDLREKITNLSFNLYLPKGIDVEIKRVNYHGHGVEIDGRDIEGNWIVDVYGNTIVQIDEESILKIDADVEEFDYSGNIDWVIEKKNDVVKGVSYISGKGENTLRLIKGSIEVVKID